MRPTILMVGTTVAALMLSPLLWSPAAQATTGSADSAGYFDSSDGTFHLRDELSPGTSEHAYPGAPAGSGIVPLTGDWDGIGHAGTGYYNRADGTFHLRDELSPGTSEHAFGFGPTGANIIPVTGDWDGDGHTSVGYFNTTDGTFHLRNSLSPGASDYAFGGAPAGSGIVPVTGDWDGDGHTSTGYFNRADGTFHLRNELSPGTSEYAFGFAPTGSGIVPVTGDWDGDGHTSIGYFNTGDGTIHLRNELSPGTSEYAYPAAPAGSGITPVTGNWEPAPSTDCTATNSCTPTTFADAMLNYAGVNAPVNAANEYAIGRWEAAEGGGAGCPGQPLYTAPWANSGEGAGNPLNTTRPEPGSVPINSAGVMNYHDSSGQTCWHWGVKANGDALTNGLYGGVISVLQNPAGDAATQCRQLAQAVAASPWGTGDFSVLC